MNCYLPGLSTLLGLLGWTNTLTATNHHHHHHHHHDNSTIFQSVLTLLGTMAIAFGLLLEYVRANKATPQNATQEKVDLYETEVVAEGRTKSD